MRSYSTRFWPLIRLLCLGLLTFLATQAQISELWPNWAQIYQRIYHADVLNGQAGNPWQYRVLPTYLAEGLIRLVRWFGAQEPSGAIFTGMRALQNLAIFLVAWRYYRRLGVAELLAWLGVGCLGWAMVLGYYNSDMQFSTYFDLLFYLLAGLILAAQRHLWLLVPLMVVAALNRETSGLIPAMVAIAALIWPDPRRRQGLLIAAAGLCLYAVIFVALRMAFPPQRLLGFGAGPGSLDMVLLNVGRVITYVKVLGVLGIVPVIALYGWRTWPPVLRAFFWAIVPAWFAVHLAAAILAESRLLLVPQALVFIPGALLAIARGTAGADAPAAPDIDASGSATGNRSLVFTPAGEAPPGPPAPRST